MTREEYLNKLSQALSKYEDDFAADIMEDYKRHFDEAAADGRSDDSVCEELGNVEDFINDIPEEFRKKMTKTSEGSTSGTGKASKEEPVTEGVKLGARAYSEDFDRIAREAGKAAMKAGKTAINVASEVADNMGNMFTKLGDMITKAVDEDKARNSAHEDSVDIDDFDSYANVNNPLLFGEYSDIENICLNLVEADIEVRQGNSSFTTITLSRPLTKKEMMYYEIDDSLPKMLKISAGIRKGLNFNINIKSDPVTFYVNLPYYLNDLTLSTVSGRIDTASDIRVNNAKITSTSGAITSDFALYAKSVAMETVSGRIGGINDIGASEVKLRTVSGQVNSRLECSTFNVGTVSGGIDIEVKKKGDGKIDTVSGGIKVKLLSDIGAVVNSSSMSGSLRVLSDKKLQWDGGNNVAMMGIFNKGSRKVGFGDEGLTLRTNSVSGSVLITDYDKA